MSYKFFVDSLVSKFIKSFLSNVKMPMYQVLSDSDVAINGMTYIKNGAVYNCIKTGRGEYAEFKHISPYRLESSVYNVDQKFVSNHSYYDSDTHEYLGKYLRYYRDMHGIDLMPFYNCFSERYSGIIELDDINYGYESKRTNKRVAIVPVMFDKKYIISLDSTSEIKIRYLLLDNDGNPITTSIDNYNMNLNSILMGINIDYICGCDSYSGINKTVHQYSNSVSAPSVITASLLSDSLQDYSRLLLKKYEKYLKLVIELPPTFSDSISIIEGPYSEKPANFNVFDLSDTDRAISTIIENKYDFIRSNFMDLSKSFSFFNSINYIMDEIGKDTQNKIMNNKLSLLSYSTSISRPFSNKLVEYLLGNVITSEDEIDNNITSLQSAVQIRDYFDVIGSVWYDYIRCLLFNKYYKDIEYDFNGFTDKDLEKILMKEGLLK